MIEETINSHKLEVLKGRIILEERNASRIGTKDKVMEAKIKSLIQEEVSKCF